MLHIVLLVLKIIGILILVILGLVLFLLLAGLTVPVRYGIRGSYYGKVKGSVKITWLLHIVSAVISYDGETFVRVKLFGIPIYRPDKKKAGEIGRAVLDDLEPEIPAAKETADGAARTVKKAEKKLFGRGKKKQKTSGKDGTDRHKDREKKGAVMEKREASQEKTVAESVKRAAVPEKSVAEPEKRTAVPEKTVAESEKRTAVPEKISAEPEKRTAIPEKPEADVNFRADMPEDMAAEPDSRKSSGKHPFRFLTKIWEFIKNLPRRVSGFINKLKRLYRRIRGRLRQADTAVRELKAWIEDEENKKMLREVWHHAKALIRHGLPRKVKGKVVFGFDDPYVTGQVLSYGAMLYPFYGRQIRIQPVFDRVIFECEGTIKGRIRVGTVCFRLLGAYRNKNFKALIKKWMG